MAAGPPRAGAAGHLSRGHLGAVVGRPVGVVGPAAAKRDEVYKNSGGAGPPHGDSSEYANAAALTAETLPAATHPYGYNFQNCYIPPHSSSYMTLKQHYFWAAEDILPGAQGQGPFGMHGAPIVGGIHPPHTHIKMVVLPQMGMVPGIPLAAVNN